MSLQLNNPAFDLDYKRFPEEGTGRITRLMPLLIAEGRTPLSFAGFMMLSLVPASYVLLPNWKPHIFGTGDGAVRHSDGRMKVVLDAPYLRRLTSTTELMDSRVDLSDAYATLDGEEFNQEQVNKYCGRRLSKHEALKNPVLRALARDKALLSDFIDTHFMTAYKLTHYEGKMMGIEAPRVPEHGAVGNSWCVDVSSYWNCAIGDSCVDDGLWQLVGVKPKALDAQVLEERIRSDLSRGEAFEHKGLVYNPEKRS